tara:strand:- start:151 stop:759 length:609 start_codon:yes stop_codon:yes gene_type:complete
VKILLPISYLGPIEYFAFIIQNKKTIIEKQENFLKQTIRNRCEIYNSNGIQHLTVHKKRKSSSKIKISEIEISNDHHWKKNHIKAIKSAYSSSPFFDHYFEYFEEIYNLTENKLFNLNLKFIELTLQILGSNNEITYTSTYNNNFNGIDLRNYQFDTIECDYYDQVFNKNHGFIRNLSIIDLIFNLGPESLNYLENIKLKHL